jgi:Flp pilus assembly protein TadG
MSPAFSRRCRSVLGEAGAASVEFALVALPFTLILIAGADLGRYFITQHSLRTLTSEAARATLVCSRPGGVCHPNPANTCPCQLTAALAQTVAATVPFLTAANIGWPSGLPVETAPDVNGVVTINVTASYPFTFILPAWTGLNANSPITESTSLQF